MGSWKLVLDEAAVQFFCSLRAAERRKLLHSFEQLKADPQRKSDFIARDATGRSSSVSAIKPFLVTYWLDALVSEIRVVDVQRVRY